MDSTNASAVAGVGVVFGLLILVVGTFMYFIPTIIAIARKHTQTLAIFFLNLLLGWSVLGWIGAFIWSLTTPAPPQTVIINNQTPPTALPPSAT